MREIKFRAWMFNKMVYDVWPTGKGTIGRWLLNKEETEARFVEGGGMGVDIMQYTGLKDSKNIDIYEGDILTKRTRSSFEPPIGQVEFDDGGFVMRWAGGKSFERMYQRLMRHFQIIGNIYEHPELLT